jgi:uncharacterized protein (TIGR03067 family)
MFHARLASFSVLVFMLTPPLVRAEPREDPNPLIGTWTVISVDVNGKRQDYVDWEVNDEIAFTGKNVIGLSTGDKAAVSKLELYPGETPKQFKRLVYGNGGGEKLYLIGVGIYSISGDTLEWCEVYTDNPVPNEFKTAKGDKRTLIVLKRTKLKPKDS